MEKVDSWRCTSDVMQTKANFCFNNNVRRIATETRQNGFLGLHFTTNKVRLL